MSDSELLTAALDSRVQRRENRRAFFAAAVGAGAFMYANAAAAQAAPTEADVLNFALNLEYLEANFYYYAAFGQPIPTASINGGVPADRAAAADGTLYNAGAHGVPFSDPAIRAYAREIARDELAHVDFLRTTLAASAVAQPALDIGIRPDGAFSNAARAAGFFTDTATAFDPYADDLSFLYGAFIFEDVGVTAYKGSAALLNTKAYIDAAAGILAAEAYHAAIVRTSIDRIGDRPGLKGATLRDDTELVSNARDSLDGTDDRDQGIARSTTGVGLTANIAPTNADGQAFSRSAAQVLNIVYLNRAAVTLGGFFPAGVNGNIKTSANNTPAA